MKNFTFYAPRTIVEEILEDCPDCPVEKEVEKSPGFSLLELIFALGILSLGVLFLSSLSITTMKANTISRTRTAALQLAQEKMESIKTLPFSELRGEVEPGLKIGTLGTLFQRETTVQKGSGASSADITVRVLWANASNPTHSHSTELFTRIAG
jgi:prepilin-type N-terminal cleavage/methylation domain-containing protein